MADPHELSARMRFNNESDAALVLAAFLEEEGGDQGNQIYALALRFDDIGAALDRLTAQRDKWYASRGLLVPPPPQSERPLE